MNNPFIGPIGTKRPHYWFLSDQKDSPDKRSGWDKVIREGRWRLLLISQLGEIFFQGIREYLIIPKYSIYYITIHIVKYKQMNFLG